MTKSKTDTNVVKRLVLRVPGSTSNLGPGFDTLGLAVQLYNTVTFEVLDSPRQGPAVHLCQRTNQNLPLDESNHIFKIAAAELAEHADVLARLRLSIDSDIPTGSGLGSSGTATLAACYGALWLRGRVVDRGQLLKRAIKHEGHPDNVSPSLYGGLTVSAVDRRGHVVVERLGWPERWKLLFVVPKRELSTSQARAALPAKVPLKDAVFNVQHVALLLAAICRADESSLPAAFQDSLHEPYRERLIPELVAVRKVVRDLPVLGCCLSGAGPTVMVVAHKRHSRAVHDALSHWSEQQPSASDVLELAVASEGLAVLKDE